MLAAAKIIVFVVVVTALYASSVAAEKPTCYMLHGGMTHEPTSEDSLRFVEQVKPDTLVIGVFDQRLYLTEFATGKARAQKPDEPLVRKKQALHAECRSPLRKLRSRPTWHIDLYCLMHRCMWFRTLYNNLLHRSLYNLNLGTLKCRTKSPRDG